MTTQFLPSAPSPGEIVRVRQRQYLVEDVQPPPEPGEATLVSMSCLDDDAQGEALEVLWEQEIDTEVVRASWDRLGRRDFDAPSRFAAYLHALRWNCVTATNPRLFQSPWRAGIEVMSYQLEPLRKALRLPRVNLFIADDVGLGKTIEAGLVLREMLMRQRVRRAVVVAPPSVVIQWKEELEQRFGLTFVIYDRDYVARCRRERGYAVNPWTTHSRFILSHALLRDEEYAAPLRDLLSIDENGKPRDGADPGSLLILDEAHHAAPASSSKYAIDSQFTRAVRDLAERFEHRLFLSATPHNGLSNSFSALLEILDPQRFVRGTPVEPKLRDEVMVRRLKADLREVSGGFPVRKIVKVDLHGLPADAPELALAKLLDEYWEAREERLEGLPRPRRVHARAPQAARSERDLVGGQRVDALHAAPPHARSARSRGDAHLRPRARAAEGRREARQVALRDRPLGRAQGDPEPHGQEGRQRSQLGARANDRLPERQQVQARADPHRELPVVRHQVRGHLVPPHSHDGSADRSAHHLRERGLRVHPNFASVALAEGAYREHVRTGTQTVEMEVLAHDYAWESYHSEMNRAGSARVPSQLFSAHFNLRGVAQSFDQVLPDGSPATITLSGVDGLVGDVVYIREDLLRHYVGDRAIVWLAFGERELRPYPPSPPAWLVNAQRGRANAWNTVITEKDLTPSTARARGTGSETAPKRGANKPGSKAKAAAPKKNGKAAVKRKASTAGKTKDKTSRRRTP